MFSSKAALLRKRIRAIKHNRGYEIDPNDEFPHVPCVFTSTYDTVKKGTKAKIYIVESLSSQVLVKLPDRTSRWVPAKCIKKLED